MTIKTLLAPNKTAIWTALLWTAFIVFMCLKRPSGEEIFYFPNADKVVHFTFYLGFVILWYRYLVFRNSILLNNKIVLVLLSILFGIMIEFAQKYLTTTRQADIIDVLANSSGSVAGIFMATLFYKNKVITRIIK